jgi:molybdate transport system substrate-binding protein
MEPQLATFPGLRFTRRRVAWLLLAAALFSILIPGAVQTARAADDQPLVACASSMRFAMEELSADFTAKSGRKIRLAYGSSGNFTRQIMQGAPFELFFSADNSYPLRLAENSLTMDEGMPYALGRLALFVPKGSPLAADPSLADLGAAIEAGKVKRFAIASPEHAPYGRAAREALQAKGLWEKIRPSLVYGENVAQAAQFASSGSSQGGIIAYSLALAPEIARLGTAVLLPLDGHKPLVQRMVLIKGAGETAQAFYRYMSSDAAHAILRKHGFAPPQDAV